MTASNFLPLHDEVDTISLTSKQNHLRIKSILLSSLQSAAERKKVEDKMATIHIESEVNARVLQIHANVGDHVKADDVLMLVESMKMEIPILAPASGVVVAVHAQAEQTIDEGQLLAELNAE